MPILKPNSADKLCAGQSHVVKSYYPVPHMPLPRLDEDDVQDTYYFARCSPEHRSRYDLHHCSNYDPHHHSTSYDPQPHHHSSNYDPPSSSSNMFPCHIFSSIYSHRIAQILFAIIRGIENNIHSMCMTYLYTVSDHSDNDTVRFITVRFNSFQEIIIQQEI